MIERFKQALVVAVLLVIGWIYYLLRSVENLRFKNAQLNTEKDLGEALEEMKDAKTKADQTESDYSAVRDALLRAEHDDGGDSGPLSGRNSRLR